MTATDPRPDVDFSLPERAGWETEPRPFLPFGAAPRAELIAAVRSSRRLNRVRVSAAALTFAGWVTLAFSAAESRAELILVGAMTAWMAAGALASFLTGEKKVRRLIEEERKHHGHADEGLRARVDLILARTEDINRRPEVTTGIIRPGRRHDANAFHIDTVTSGHTIAVVPDTLRLPPRQLAAVLAHEVGHALASTSAWSSAVSSLALKLLPGGTLAFFTTALGALAVTAMLFASETLSQLTTLAFVLIAAAWFGAVVNAPFSRRSEHAADRIAVLLTGDPEGVAAFFETDDSPLKTGRIARLFATHPLSNDRAARIRCLPSQPPVGKAVLLPGIEIERVINDSDLRPLVEDLRAALKAHSRRLVMRPVMATDVSPIVATLTATFTAEGEFEASPLLGQLDSNNQDATDELEPVSRSDSAAGSIQAALHYAYSHIALDWKLAPTRLSIEVRLDRYYVTVEATGFPLQGKSGRIGLEETTIRREIRA